MKPLRNYKNIGELALDLFPLFKSPDFIKKEEALYVKSVVTKLEGKGYVQPFFAPNGIKGSLERHLLKIIEQSKEPAPKEKIFLKATIKECFNDFKLPEKKLYGLSTVIEATGDEIKWANFQLSYDPEKGFKIEELTLTHNDNEVEKPHERLFVKPRAIPTKEFSIAFLNLSLKSRGNELTKVLKQRIE